MGPDAHGSHGGDERQIAEARVLQMLSGTGTNQPLLISDGLQALAQLFPSVLTALLGRLALQFNQTMVGRAHAASKRCRRKCRFKG